MEVTEKWLSDIGGWQAMKSAREFVRKGQVTNATRDGIIFRGDVGEGKRSLRATLVAAGGMKTEAKCGCAEARRGLICPHAIAVALSIISPHLVGKVPGTDSPPAQGTLHGGADRGANSGQAMDAGGGSSQLGELELPEEKVPAGSYEVRLSLEHLLSLGSIDTATATPTASKASREGRGPSTKATRAPGGDSVPVSIQFRPEGEPLEGKGGHNSSHLALARWLHRNQMPLAGRAPQLLRLPAPAVDDLLEALLDHPSVQSVLLERVQKDGPDRSSFQDDTDILNISSFQRLILHSEIDKQRHHVVFQLSGQPFQLLNVDKSCWLFFKESQSLVAAPNIPAVLLSFWKALASGAPVNRPIRWVASHLPALAEFFELLSGEDSAESIRLIPANPVFQCHLEGSQRQIQATISLHRPHRGILGQERGTDGVTDDVNSDYPVQDVENALVFYTRNFPAEFALQRQVQTAGFALTNIPNKFELKGEREVLHFLASDLAKLRQRFEVVEGDGFRNLTKSFAVIRPFIKSAKNLSPPTAKGAADSGADTRGAGSGTDWLTLEVAYEASDGFHIPRQDVLRLIRSGKRDYQGRDGKRYLIDVDSCEELESTLQDVNTRFTGGNHVAIRGRQVEALEAFLPVGSPILLDPVPYLEEEALRGGLGRFGEMLRPYQMEGVRWLERHSRSGGGGLLADEMGLGKTVQTLALLKLILARRSPVAGQGPALVVCPTSLLGNWSDEAARFTPELKTHVSHDSKRHAALEKLSEFDVIFTSYALIQRDLEYYVSVKFCAIVLDEASYIRNPDTESARAVRQLQAGSRFALTGTPVENSVKDLWSIFAFTLPGYLPILADFNERFVKPLAKVAASTPPSRSLGTGAGTGLGEARSPAAAIMERLRRLIRPHILRRTKREVAKELPEKIEKVLWCELTPAQKSLYQRMLDEGREEIRAARTRSGQAGGRMTMFTVLLRLRQICNDLSLVGVRLKDWAPNPNASELGGAAVKPPGSGSKRISSGAKAPTASLSSGKLPVYEELLQESLEGGHKTLIFSQFVGMLKLLRAHADAQGIPYCYLDGSSTDRAAQVANFQTNPEKRVFFISLKAGGYGLNLTAADEVVLVDPWWNPAVEAQAIDRAHRIGQGRPVTAYRLACRGTVEEKILALQQKKRAVMDMAMEDDAAVFAGVTDDELEELLR